jgi:K+-sensing histidine kinase KdpD
MFVRFHTTIDNTFSNRSRTTIYFISLVLLLMLGWLDYITGDYSLIIFYLIPIALVAWFVGKGSGLFFCVLSLITRIIADEAETSFAFKFSTLHYWNVFVEFVFLLIMSLLCSALKKSLEKQQPKKTPDPVHDSETDP